MKKILTIPIAAMLLLLAASCSEELVNGNPPTDDPAISIGNLAVAGQADATTRAGEDDGLDNWYPGDQLYVEDVGASTNLPSGYNIAYYTPTPHGTWKVKDGTGVKQVSEVTEAGPFLATKGGDRSDQSNWEGYHWADYISGYLELNRTTGQLYSKLGSNNKPTSPLNHLNADVVITLTRGTGWDDDAAWQNHIRHASITIHSIKDNKPVDYTPWLAKVIPSEGEPTDGDGYEPGSATLRAHIAPKVVPPSGSKIITITPADGSNPITGTYTLKLGAEFNHTDNKAGFNQRLCISFTYDNKRSLSLGKATVTPWADGGTTPIDYNGYDMTIRTEDDLKLFRDLVNGGQENLTAIQVANITLKDAWTPIGRTVNIFKGTYNGGGCTISGVRFDNSLGDYAGFFGQINGAILTDIHLVGATVNGGIRPASVGTLVATANNSYIRHCTSRGGSATGSFGSVGGLVGVSAASHIAYCHAQVEAGGYFSVGGLVGSIDASSTVTACYATGSVTSDRANAGGLVGNNRGTITACYATGSVTALNYAGSLVGENTGTGLIAYSHATLKGDAIDLIGINNSAQAPQHCSTTPGQAGNTVRSWPGDGTFTADVWGPGPEPTLQY